MKREVNRGGESPLLRSRSTNRLRGNNDSEFWDVCSGNSETGNRVEVVVTSPLHLLSAPQFSKRVVAWLASPMVAVVLGGTITKVLQPGKICNEQDGQESIVPKIVIATVRFIGPLGH